ncbi:MAG: hypothetical protein DCC68_15735 [Planctomycetota bacterium]|nr:MAG: hypothetical protein DCC68_15735 [Planctomycetota bacterium]
MGPEMKISERLLYRLVRLFYRTEVAHSPEMKQALQDIESFDAYRGAEIARILEACDRYDIPIAGRRVLDFGCNDGAISPKYLQRGALSVVGVDVDEEAIGRAQANRRDDGLSFVKSNVDGVPLEDESIDTIVSYDVFEHVSEPKAILSELRRILAPSGQILIGTWSWRHPFAPHLWAVMPVPWAHMFFSERTILRVCRRVYHSPWYVPNMHDFDANGERLADKYTNDMISTDYLNKYLIVDFEATFESVGFDCQTHCVPFGSKYARWTGFLLRAPWVREFLSGYVWFVLSKPKADKGLNGNGDAVASGNALR